MSTPNFNDTTTGNEVVAHFKDRASGRTVLITGVSETGIGGATALALARGGVKTLILAGRSEARVQPVVDAARGLQSGTTVIFLQLDLASLASVRAAAHKILADASIPALDILINNAGISGAEYRTTGDGIEEMFAVCHVGHWLLTSLLMPKLIAAPEPRVVNLTSTGHNYWDGVFEDYNFQRADRPYSHTLAYGQAKAANIVFTKALVQRFGDRGLKAYSVQPGWVQTNLTSSWTPEQLQTAFAAAQASGLEFGEKPKTLEQGCSTTGPRKSPI